MAEDNEFFKYLLSIIEEGGTIDRENPRIKSVLDEIQERRGRKLTKKEWERTEEMLKILRKLVQS